MKQILTEEKNLTSWDALSLPWQWCIEEAWKSYCMGSLPIGAVVTDEQGHLLARGRNRIYEHEAEGQLLCGHRLAHAEINALISVKWGDINPHKCSLYTTTEPCPLCVGAIRLSRIGTVYYGSRDQGAGSIELFTANPFMMRAGIHIDGPGCSPLENILIALLIEMMLHKQEKNIAFFYQEVASVHPVGATLGKQLFAQGRLVDWQIQKRPVSYVFNQLLFLLNEYALSN